MTESHPGTQAKRPAGRARMVIGGVLLLVLLLFLAYVFRQGMQYTAAVKLHEEGKSAEAARLLEKLRPIGPLRRKVRVSLRSCYMEMAFQVGNKTRTFDGWREAIALLEKGKALAGGTPELERRLKEFRGYLGPPDDEKKKQFAEVEALIAKRKWSHAAALLDDVKRWPISSELAPTLHKLLEACYVPIIRQSAKSPSPEEKEAALARLRALYAIPSLRKRAEQLAAETGLSPDK